MHSCHSLFSDRDATLTFNQVFSLPGAFQFGLLRKGWFICRSVHKDYHQAAVVTDFNMATIHWLHRCSFALRPLAANENALMNCFETTRPSTPPGTPVTTSKPSTLPTIKPTPHKPEGKMESNRGLLI